LDYLLADLFATHNNLSGGAYWFVFGMFFAVLPGGILSWPGFVMVLISLAA
jgi:hypothetical protein